MKHQNIITRKKETELSKVMDKYTQLNRFYHDQILKVYMYAFIYVDPDTMPVREYFLDTIFF